MSEVWFPGAIQDPGMQAGYANGRNLMRTAVLHFTVGTNSQALIRNNGLAQFLLPKVGPPIQFCPVDALCFHAGTWNPDGPGLEFERMSYDEPLTADQLFWGGELIVWLCDGWKFALTLWDGERVIATDAGFINHGSVLGRGTEHADHTDGVLRSEWDAMTATPLKGVDMIYKAVGTSTTNPAVVNGSLWVIVGQFDGGTLLVHGEETAAVYPACPVVAVDGELLGKISKFSGAGGAGSASVGPWTIKLAGTAQP